MLHVSDSSLLWLLYDLADAVDETMANLPSHLHPPCLSSCEQCRDLHINSDMFAGKGRLEITDVSTTKKGKFAVEMTRFV